jgi:uncharacterized protein (DUF1800 family)
LASVRVRRRSSKRRSIWRAKPGRWEVETPVVSPTTPDPVPGTPPAGTGTQAPGTPQWTAEQLSLIRHLFRRAGFGITAARAQRFLDDGGYAAAVEFLLDTTTPDPADTISPPLASAWNSSTDRYTENVNASVWWTRQMVAANNPLRQKLAFFWHDHFANQFNDGAPRIQQAQLTTIKANMWGNFETFVLAMCRDTLLIRWLSGDLNRRRSPNVNFARELLELFTLGIGNYSEADVRDAGRAFTGWHIASPDGPFFFNSSQHDYDVKTVMGVTGTLDGMDIVRIATNSATSKRYICAKLWSYFAYPVATNDPVIDPLVVEYSKALNIKDTLRVMFMHPEFVGTTAMNAMLKNPLEFYVGMHRAVGIDVRWADRSAYWDMYDMGMVPYFPPNVAGWEANAYWANVSQVSSRLDKVAWRVAGSSPAWLTAIPREQRLNALADRLGIDGWGAASTAALNAVSANGSDLLHMAFLTPEYARN